MKLTRAPKISTLFAVGFAVGAALTHRHAPLQLTRPDEDALLLQRIHAVRLHGYTTYLGGVTHLQKLTHANIAVDWPGLAELGIHPETPIMVELPLHDITLEQLLAKFTASGGTRDRQLRWKVQDGIIVLAADPAELSPGQMISPARMLTRSYDVGDMLDAGGPWERIAIDTEKGYLPPSERAYVLMWALRRFVHPNSWTEARGLGSMRLFGNHLIVTQTRSNHAALVEMLDLFRHPDNEDAER